MTTVLDDTADCEVVVTRHFDAPPELVWQAWTDPDRVVQWWGPAGFTTTIDVMDVRPGGVWQHTMHGPDGRDFPSRIVFREVVRPRRITYRLEGGTAVLRVECDVVWMFDPAGTGTRLTMQMVFPSVAARDRAIAALGVRDAGVVTLERLAAHLRAREGAR